MKEGRESLVMSPQARDQSKRVPPMLSFKCQELDQLGISPQKEGKHTAQQIENMVT